MIYYCVQWSMKKLLTHQNVPTCVVKLSYFFQPAASSGLGVMAFLVNVTDFLFAYNHGQNILATFWAPHTAHDRSSELKHNGLGSPYPPPPSPISMLDGWLGVLASRPQTQHWLWGTGGRWHGQNIAKYFDHDCMKNWKNEEKKGEFKVL